MGLNGYISLGAFGMFLIQLVFVINFFHSIRNGEKVKGDNPWQSTTVEWQAPTPPPHGNFPKEPVIYGGPYEYSVPGAAKDFIPQTQKKRPQGV